MLDRLGLTLAAVQNAILELVDPSQVILLLTILGVAWLLQPLLCRSLAALVEHLPATTWSHKLLTVLQGTILPLTALVLAQLSQGVAKAIGRDTPLLDTAIRPLIIWLGYRLAAALLEVNVSAEKAHFWRRKILLPLAMVAGLLSIFGRLTAVFGWGIYLEALGWRLTLGSILLAVAIIISFVAVSRWARPILANAFLLPAGLEQSLANTISKLVGYAIITSGVLLALSSMGVNLTGLTVIAGGLSVGLAFGLQEIFSNFVSGFIILFERSLEPGDIVEVDGRVGTVQTVSIRSTTIATRDNVELIIPNSYFLTEIVTNFTHREDLVRTRIRVGVSYGSNPRDVEQALLAAATQHPRVRSEPPPTVQFQDFGDSSLDFDLFVWTDEAVEMPILTSELRYDVWDALAARNIEIPFPQRDIHIRSGVPWSAFTQPIRDLSDQASAGQL